jgi:glycosyltransferase involved in cell wall biosynthesis
MSAALRVGLVGWACRTGVGQLNADLARRADWIRAWLVPEHPRHGIDPALLPAGRARPCAPVGDVARYERFLDDVDAVLFVERQYVLEGFDLAREARARGKVVCAIPMMEFVLDGEPWLSHADLLWAPTRWTRAELAALARRRDALARATGDPRWRSPWAGRIRGGRLGIDVARFPFRLRERAERFLFVNGRGGFLGRKGADVVAGAAALAPEVPLRVLSQVDLPALPAHVEVERGDRPDRAGLYARGDVLLVPSRWEGVGQPLYEGQACGLPVLATGAPPLDESGAMPLPVARVELRKARRRVRSHEVRPEELAAALRRWHGRDVARASRAGRRRIERQHDLRDTLRALGAAIAEARAARPQPRARAAQPVGPAAPSER